MLIGVRLAVRHVRHRRFTMRWLFAVVLLCSVGLAGFGTLCVVLNSELAYDYPTWTPWIELAAISVLSILLLTPYPTDAANSGKWRR